MSPTPLHVLLIGSCTELHGLESADRRAGVPDSHGACLRVYEANCADEALGRIEQQGLQPDVIVLGVQWPGQVETGTLERLARVAPLARVVYSVGCWCQGISTTKELCDSLPRLIEPTGDVRLQRELEELAWGSVWCGIARPVTATVDERLAAGVAGMHRGRGWMRQSEARPESDWGPAGRPLPRSPVDLATGIVSPDPHFREWLGEALKARGERAYLRESPDDFDPRVDRIVWDLTPWTDATAARVRSVVRRLPETPVFAVVAFPRPHQRRELHEAGVAAFLSKPFLLADLFWLLDGGKACEQRRAVVPVEITHTAAIADCEPPGLSRRG